MKHWEKAGFSAIRAAGSHGLYDVVGFRVDRKPQFIQCKALKSAAAIAALTKKFRENTVPSQHYHQILAYKVKGTKGFNTVVV